MITVVHHAADRVVIEATRVLRDLSARGLLADIAVVEVGEAAWSGQPAATCVRAGEDVAMGLFDALATDPATDGHVLTAVASADLAPRSQLELAGELTRIADRAIGLAGVPVVASCLFVPESGDGGILPAAGFFSAATANFVALPTDWRFVDGAAVAVEYDDADRAAWHAALEIATLTSAWGAVAQSRWQPEVLAPGVSGHGLRFVRSATRLVTVRRSGPAAAVENVLPTPEGFSPTPVPELVERAAVVLHPEVFRLEGRLDEAGALGGPGGVLRLLAGAVGGLFPPLASGLRGFWRLLCTEVARALGGDAGSGEGDHPPVSRPDRQASDETAVVLEGFEPRVWTDLVRNVLGAVDGGGTADAVEARRAAGHERFVFVTRDSLVDDVLRERIGGQPSGDRDASAGADGADDADDGGDVRWRGSEYRIGGGTRESAASGARASRDTGPAEEADDRRGLLTLIDDVFRGEVSRARRLRRQHQEEFDELVASAERAEQSEPTAALRRTIVAFVVTAFVVVASYVLLLDAFDFGDVDRTLRTRLAIVATAFTWLVLQYPLAPRGGDTRAVQSHLLRSAAVIAVVAALAAVFADPISDVATGRPWLEIIPILAALVTFWLAWRVLRSEHAGERSAGRALALAWTICYLIAGLFLYANMEHSIFGRWGWLRRFLENYGDGIRYAAVAVAGFLFLLALTMLAVSDAGADRHRRRARARMGELRLELQREDLVPVLRGLRVNWLGTAAALEYIMRRAFPPPSPADDDDGGLRSPLLRLALHSREAYYPPPPPGWLFAQYEMAVGAYGARRDARAGGARWIRPETATMVSPLDRDLLASSGTDPRWDFAHRLGAGEFDDALVAGLPGADDGSLLDEDLVFMGEVAPVAPGALPLGLVGPLAAGLGHVAMQSTWWWPDGFAVPDLPDSAPRPRPAQTLRSTAGQAYVAVRLDVSDPILERQISGGSSPPVEPEEEPPPSGPDDGLR